MPREAKKQMKKRNKARREHRHLNVVGNNINSKYHVQHDMKEETRRNKDDRVVIQKLLLTVIEIHVARSECAKYKKMFARGKQNR